MDLRLGLSEIAAAHRLDAEATRRLEDLAGLHAEPAGLATWLPRGVAVLAAALGGLGIVFWIAANWETLGRFGRFALLQAFVVAMCAGALWKPAARAPLGLLALLAIGALFAYFGQTYQTGADPWQLFAVWAALALPLCLAARSDVLWAPWALIVMTGISLWVHAHTGHRWRVQPDDLAAHLAAWGSALVLVAFLSAPLRGVTGAGVWGQRVAIALAVVMITLTAIGGLAGSRAAMHYGLGLLVLAVGGRAAGARRIVRDLRSQRASLSASTRCWSAAWSTSCSIAQRQQRLARQAAAGRARRRRPAGSDRVAAAAAVASPRSDAMSAAAARGRACGRRSRKAGCRRARPFASRTNVHGRWCC